MAGKRIGYVRVSTVDQTPDRQLHGIELDKKFVEYASGSSTDRPQLKALIEYARDDDIVYVHSLDRLARNLRDLLSLIDLFNKNKVTLIFLNENLTFDGKETPVSKLLLQIMGAAAEFERAITLERQREGIERARAKGVYGQGRKKALTEKDIPTIESYLKHKWQVDRIAEHLKVSRTTIYEFIKTHKLEFDKRKTNPLNSDQINQIRQMAKNGFSKKEIAKELGIKLYTLYPYLRKYRITVTKYKAR